MVIFYFWPRLIWLKVESVKFDLVMVDSSLCLYSIFFKTLVRKHTFPSWAEQYGYMYSRDPHSADSDNAELAIVLLMNYSRDSHSVVQKFA